MAQGSKRFSVLDSMGAFKMGLHKGWSRHSSHMPWSRLDHAEAAVLIKGALRWLVTRRVCLHDAYVRLITRTMQGH